MRPLHAAACVLVATLATMLAACQESMRAARRGHGRRCAGGRPTSNAASDSSEVCRSGHDVRARDITFDDLKFEIEKGEPFERLDADAQDRGPRRPERCESAAISCRAFSRPG